MNFEKPKEVFSQHGKNNNNLSHISHRCYILGESRASLSPIFRDSIFSCLRHLFQTQIPTTGDEFQKTERGFFSEQDDLQKPPPYFTQLSQSGRIEDFLGPYFFIILGGE
jgi:hypothetical protein